MIADDFKKEDAKVTYNPEHPTEAQMQRDDVAFLAKKRNPNYPLGEFDGLKWAEEFMRIYGKSKITTNLMHSWFANAIMTGYDSVKIQNNSYSAGYRTGYTHAVEDTLNNIILKSVDLLGNIEDMDNEVGQTDYAEAASCSPVAYQAVATAGVDSVTKGTNLIVVGMRNGSFDYNI